MNERIEEIIKNKYCETGIILIIFPTKKLMKRYLNTHKNPHKSNVFMTIDEIETYGLDGYKIKEYKYVEEI